jgi:beta-phosphoglucomutase
VSAPTAVVFDMDGVVVDSGAHHRAAWRAMLAELGITPADDFWRLTIGRPAEEAVPLVVGRALGFAETARLALRKRDHYVRLARNGPRAIAGVAGFLEGLAAARVPRALATSASRLDVDRLLRALGLRHHFATVVTAEDVVRGKPDPEVYRRAAQGLGHPPARCLAFEDSLVGVQAARAAGMRVIGLTTAHTAAELREAGAERSVPSFEDLTWPP